jgi:copper ion binding protein
MNVVELDVEGMTCAACAARIERSVNKLDGVEASVNLATEKATVRFDQRRLAVEKLIGVHGVEVSLAQANARVTYDSAKTGVSELKRAVERAAYEAP